MNSFTFIYLLFFPGFTLTVSNGFFVAAKSAMDKSVVKKLAMTNLHPIIAVVDSIAKLF